MTTLEFDLTDPRLVHQGVSELGRAGWLGLRRDGLGSSDAAAVLGWSPYTSPWALWLDKSGVLPDDESNEAMEWGHRLEEAIAQGFAERTGMTLVNPDAMYRHADYDWMLANPDRLALSPHHPEGGLVECKNVNAFKVEEWRSGEPDSDEVIRGGEAPAHYLVQVQHQHAVLGTRWGYLAALLGGNRLVVVEVPRDDELIAMLTAAEEGFWTDHVLSGQPPPMDGMATTTDLLVQLFSPAEEGSSREVGDDAAEAITDYHRAHAALNDAKEAKALAGNRLRNMLGETEEGTWRGVPVVTWRAPKPHMKPDLDALRTDFPEVAEKVSKEVVPARRIDVKRSEAALAALGITDGGKE